LFEGCALAHMYSRMTLVSRDELINAGKPAATEFVTVRTDTSAPHNPNASTTICMATPL
jgi:hypothetical protein